MSSGGQCLDIWNGGWAAFCCNVFNSSWFPITSVWNDGMTMQGIAGEAPNVSIEEDMSKSSWKAILLLRRVKGSCDIQFSLRVSPIWIREALIESFRVRCCCATAPLVCWWYKRTKETWMPRMQVNSCHKLDVFLILVTINSRIAPLKGSIKRWKTVLRPH